MEKEEESLAQLDADQGEYYQDYDLAQIGDEFNYDNYLY